MRDSYFIRKTSYIKSEMRLNMIESYDIGSIIVSSLVLTLHQLIITSLLRIKKLRKVRSNKWFFYLSFGYVILAYSRLVGLFVNLEWFAPSAYFHIKLGLVAITLDRFCSIRYPYRYTHWRRENYKICFATVLTFGTAVYFYTMQNDKYHVHEDATVTIFFVAITLSVMFTLTTTNMVLFGIARRQLQNIHKLSSSLGKADSTETNVSTRSDALSADLKTKRRQLKEIKQFYVCFSYVLTYSVMWSPAVAVKFKNLVSNDHVSPYIFSWLICFADINSIFDGIVYVTVNRDLRSAIKACCCWTK
ncbi:uncharacterized protein LOC130636320 [Hydractinia symbiolongicarpus]|uniref:uncharacterized protein LOC130636320 n=1 Tax=Hydractinia symbiolongicarpus TaxID=13093 RepID=UPI00254FF780|nr:uncharacterized protein LOC130636320 [Hydractinia symbiolongicarpus]